MNSDIFEQFNNIINNENEFKEFKEFMGLDDSFFSDNKTSDNSETQNSSNNNNDFQNIFPNIDYSQIFMMTDMLSTFNDTSDKSTNLLLSLKPFLEENRKKRIDMAIQMIKLMKIIPLLSNLNLFGGDENNENTK